MLYKFKDKNIKIPDNDIQRSMQCLNISENEAIQMWLEDEGYLINEEQEKLEQKAKTNHITATIHQATTRDIRKKTQKERVQKEDPVKEQIIKELYENFSTKYENVQIANKTKIITFTIGDDSYELNLIRHRPPKQTAN